MGPDTGKAVGLELLTDRELVLQARVLGLDAANLVAVAGDRLDVMTDLVGDHIRLGEVTGRTEAIGQLVVEPEIDVDLLIVGSRAVERADRRRGVAATGVDRIVEDHQAGGLVLATDLGEVLVPGLLDVEHQELHELHGVGIGIGDGSAGRTVGADLAARLVEPVETDVEPRSGSRSATTGEVGAEEQPENHHEDATEASSDLADTGTATGATSTSALTTTVIDVLGSLVGS